MSQQGSKDPTGTDPKSESQSLDTTLVELAIAGIKLIGFEIEKARKTAETGKARKTAKNANTGKTAETGKSDKTWLTERANDAETITKIVNAGKSAYDAYKKGDRVLVGTSIIKGLADAVGGIAENPILSKRFADAVGGIAKKPICLKHVNMPAFTSAAMDLIESIREKDCAKIASSVADLVASFSKTEGLGLTFSVLISIFEVINAINNGDDPKQWEKVRNALIKAITAYIFYTAEDSSDDDKPKSSKSTNLEVPKKKLKLEKLKVEKLKVEKLKAEKLKAEKLKSPISMEGKLKSPISMEHSETVTHTTSSGVLTGLAVVGTVAVTAVGVFAQLLSPIPLPTVMMNLKMLPNVMMNFR